MAKIKRDRPFGLRKTVYPDDSIKTLIDLQEQLSDPYIQVVTDTYTVLELDDMVICGTKGSGYPINLHTAMGHSGKTLIIKRTGTDDITINGNASEEIDGVATYTLDVQYEWVILISDGANWHIIG